MGFLMPKPYLEKNSNYTIRPIAVGEGNKRVHVFLKGISPKVSAMTQLKFEHI